MHNIIKVHYKKNERWKGKLIVVGTLAFPTNHQFIFIVTLFISVLLLLFWFCFFGWSSNHLWHFDFILWEILSKCHYMYATQHARGKLLAQWCFCVRATYKNVCPTSPLEELITYETETQHDYRLFSAVGFYCPSGQAVPNPYDYLCPKGHYCLVATSTPIRCKSGFYQNELGQSSCKTCPEGTGFFSVRLF